MPEGPFATFLITTFIGVVLAGLAWLFARRSGLLPVQTTLIDTLKDNVEALKDRVELLETQLDEARRRAKDAEARIDELEQALSDLTIENHRLRKRLGMPTKGKPTEAEP